MKKITSLPLALFLIVGNSIFVSANELPENNDIVIETTELTQENEEQTDIIEENNDNEITETSSEEIEKNEEYVIQEPPIETKENKQMEENNNLETTQGWLNIKSTINNSTFTKETKITFIFENKNTNEIIEKELSSINNFTASIKLPLGDYNVSLKETSFEDFIIYEKEISIKEELQEYKLNINSYTEKQEISEEDIEKKESMFWTLLKNNLVFLTILIGCSGYLLIKEIKKRRSDY